MNRTRGTAALSLSVLVAFQSAHAASVVSVAYGTITNVSQQGKDISGGKAGGAVLGGMVGLYSGKEKSGSNKALRTIGGAKVGSAAGGTMAKGTEAVYTVSLVQDEYPVPGLAIWKKGARWTARSQAAVGAHDDSRRVRPRP